MTYFSDHVALITGAASGLGRALLLALADEGASVAALDQDAFGLEKLAREVPARFASAVADVTDRQAVGQAVAELQSRLGPIDFLFANAGIGVETSAYHFRADDFARIAEVNLIGSANCVEAVLPGMIKRRRGHIIAISSLASYRGLPRMAGYCASKSGLNAFMDALRVELAPVGVHVSTICPGWIRTPLTESLTVPQPHRLEADEAARRILHAVRRRKRLYAFPWQSVWRLRLLSWLPPGLSDRLLYYLLQSLK
ncbi:MAG: oxidoreductase [Gemmatales bacterium]|nr:MAG: oxidoreductase [Gemmatales bacterium]